MPNEDKKTGQPASRIEGNGKRSLRRPKLSIRKFSAWKKQKNGLVSIHTEKSNKLQ
jgi:hypothetical protein